MGSHQGETLMDGEAKAAASVPIFTLLAFVAIEAVASRGWAIAICGLGLFGFLGIAIAIHWPTAKLIPRGEESRRKRLRRLRAHLEANPSIPCPECGRTQAHLADCPVIS